MDHNKILKEWYSRPEIKFEMIKYTKHRELALIVPSWCGKEMQKRSTRMLKCHSVQHLDINLNATKVFQRKTIFNVYHSVGKYKQGIPHQTLYFKERNNADWTANHWKQLNTYDFIIDIDSPNHQEIRYAKESALKIHKKLLELKMDHYIHFSGNGFHLVCPQKQVIPEFYDPYAEKNVYRILRDIAQQFYDNSSELVDLSIYDSRRVIKTPYSLACYKEKIYICIPLLSIKDLENFNINNYEYINWLEPNKIRGRGTHLFTSEDK